MADTIVTIGSAENLQNKREWHKPLLCRFDAADAEHKLSPHREGKHMILGPGVS
jgi:hypothetical protein